MTDLSVLIPARQEQWLARTVADVLEHATANTEVIVVLDGAWPDPALPQLPRVTVVYLPVSIGQRAAVNLAARLSTARYVMKLDAHCSLAPGFDAELIRTGDELGPTVTQIPAQKNLWIYDRVCPCGQRVYQGSPSVPCASCGQTAWTLDVKWQPKPGVHTTSWTVDSNLKFQYDKSGQRAQQGEICDVMTSLGACIFVNREYFLTLGGFDEGHGSWGQFGQEWAFKSWLSGGRHVVNKRTWFAHFFRVGGVGFPYPIHGTDQERARQYARDLWRRNAWPGQVHSLRWLVDKFWPIAGWTEEQRDELPNNLNLPDCMEAVTS